MYEDFVHIPEERIAVLIGKKGETKKKIEEMGAKLDIDSKTGEVYIQAEDPLIGYKTSRVVLAIGRGFSQKKAMKLYEDNMFLEIINLKEFFNNAHQMNVKKGRVIGRNGMMREKIEKTTFTDIEVYGHTIAIIGDEIGIQAAKEAILSLLGGSKHETAIKRMERRIFI